MGLTRILTDVGGSVVKYNMVVGGGDVNVGTFLSLWCWPLGYFPIMPHCPGTRLGQGRDKAGTSRDNKKKQQGQTGTIRTRKGQAASACHLLALFVPAGYFLFSCIPQP